METTRIELTQGKWAVVDASDARAVLAVGSWCAKLEGHVWYAKREIRKPDGKRTMLGMHSFLTGYARTDHRNGDGLDNRRINMRPATHAENMRNGRKRSNNTSGYVGVRRGKTNGRWIAQIKVNGVQRYLGVYGTREEAASARDAEALKLHGEFARLNFPTQA